MAPDAGALVPALRALEAELRADALREDAWSRIGEKLRLCADKLAALLHAAETPPLRPLKTLGCGCIVDSFGEPTPCTHHGGVPVPPPPSQETAAETRETDHWKEAYEAFDRIRTEPETEAEVESWKILAMRANERAEQAEATCARLEAERGQSVAAEDYDIGGTIVATWPDGSWTVESRTGNRQRRWPITERITALEADLAAVREVIRWALGEVGEFPEQPEASKNAARLYGRPRFWWRTELRKRVEAALAAAPSAPQGKPSGQEPFSSCPRCRFADGRWYPCKKHQPRPASAPQGEEKKP